MAAGPEEEVDADDAEPALPVFRFPNTAHMVTLRAATLVVEVLAVAVRAAR